MLEEGLKILAETIISDAKIFQQVGQHKYDRLDKKFVQSFTGYKRDILR